MRITITGPRSIGKTTISRIVAKKLRLKFYSSDEIGEKAFEKQGCLDKAIKSGEIGRCQEPQVKDLGHGRTFHLSKVK